MGTRIPSVRGVTQLSNGSVGQRDVIRPAPSIILLLPRTPFPFSLYREQIPEASRARGGGGFASSQTIDRESDRRTDPPKGRNGCAQGKRVGCFGRTFPKDRGLLS